MSSRARSARKLQWMTTSPSPTGAGVADHGRQHELVVLVPGVPGREPGRGRLGVHAGPVDHGLVERRHPLPALVTVHAVVATRHGRDAGARDARRRVAPRGRPGTDPPSAAACHGRRAARGRRRRRTPRDAASSAIATRCRSLAWTPPGPMRLTRCSRRPLAAACRAASTQRGVRGERAVGDRGVDARQVLEDGPAGADVEVPDLAVAHLAVRQPHGRTGGIEQRVRPALRAADATRASGRWRWRRPTGRARPRSRR